MNATSVETAAEGIGANEIIPPRFESASAMLLAGTKQRYSYSDMSGIADQWHSFVPRIGEIPEQAGKAAYGVVVRTPSAESIDYMVGVAVTDATRVPAGFETMEIPAHRYAVFTHEGHVSQMPGTIDRIFKDWLPSSGCEMSGQPDFFERYGENFDAQAGAGDVEIWVPVKS